MSASPRLARLAGWVDERTGINAVMRAALDEPIPGGARWVYVFGSALLTTLLLQFVTGILLTFYYVPSIDHAHTTVSYIQKVVELGWLVRGIHYYGASAIIALLGLHLAQVFVWGAYKDRREALWLVGVILLQLVLGFGFTGYLLPWDQKAYFGTGVAGGIAGSIPLVGSSVSQVMLGGPGLGQPTLSRFFSIHVFVLPMLTGLLIAIHLYLFRYRGPAGPMEVTEADLAKTNRFYPMQFFKDTVASVVIVALLAVLAYVRPAILGPKADPSVGFVPRPEWYFLWAFQLLKVMPAFLGGVVMPGVLFGALALAPFVDRSPLRTLRSRLVYIAIFVAALAVIGALTGTALYNDMNDPKIAQQEEAARDYMSKPFEPDSIGGSGARPAETAAAAPIPPAPAAFATNCAGCHGAEAQGGVGPSLHGVTAKPKRSTDDVVKLIADPTAYGIKTMPGFPDIPEADRRAIAEWLAKLPK
jgi:ubiquinol-cytochrome c reductase cytochrome b subunit